MQRQRRYPRKRPSVGSAERYPALVLCRHRKTTAAGVPILSAHSELLPESYHQHPRNE